MPDIGFRSITVHEVSVTGLRFGVIDLDEDQNPRVLLGREVLELPLLDYGRLAQVVTTISTDRLSEFVHCQRSLFSEERLQTLKDLVCDSGAQCFDAFSEAQFLIWHAQFPALRSAQRGMESSGDRRLRSSFPCLAANLDRDYRRAESTWKPAAVTFGGALAVSKYLHEVKHCDARSLAPPWKFGFVQMQESQERHRVHVQRDAQDSTGTFWTLSFPSCRFSVPKGIISEADRRLENASIKEGMSILELMRANTHPLRDTDEVDQFNTALQGAPRGLDNRNIRSLLEPVSRHRKRPLGEPLPEGNPLCLAVADFGGRPGRASQFGVQLIPFIPVNLGEIHNVVPIGEVLHICRVLVNQPQLMQYFRFWRELSQLLRSASARRELLRSLGIDDTPRKVSWIDDSPLGEYEGGWTFVDFEYPDALFDHLPWDFLTLEPEYPLYPFGQSHTGAYAAGFVRERLAILPSRASMDFRGRHLERIKATDMGVIRQIKPEWNKAISVFRDSQDTESTGLKLKAPAYYVGVSTTKIKLPALRSVQANL